MKSNIGETIYKLQRLLIKARINSDYINSLHDYSLKYEKEGLEATKVLAYEAHRVSPIIDNLNIDLIEGLQEIIEELESD
ncbi:hypothetical protein [Facklamia sp. P9177]|uniref:hypothetical protein n=1 Tax=Facklamia sp. P9177 TaxID=3421945 RepID=UPI003D185125